MYRVWVVPNNTVINVETKEEADILCEAIDNGNTWSTARAERIVAHKLPETFYWYVTAAVSYKDDFWLATLYPLVDYDDRIIEYDEENFRDNYNHHTKNDKINFACAVYAKDSKEAIQKGKELRENDNIISG